MKTRKIALYIAGIIILGMLGFIIYMYPFYHFFFTMKETVIDARLSVYSGAGNSGLLVTDSAVVVIDTKMAGMAKKLHKLAVEKAGNKKIIAINTHFHVDHMNGNYLYKGCAIYIGGYDAAFVKKRFEPDNMPNVFLKDSLILPLGDEVLILRNLGKGHTFDDLVVYLQKRKILFTGDLVFNHINPALYREDGPEVNQWKNLLQTMGGWDLVKVVPGHGDIGDASMIHSLVQYFDDMQEAAATPAIAAEMKNRYSGWRKMPFMSSPQRTINFLKGE